MTNPVDRHIALEIVRWSMIVQTCASLLFIVTQSARLAPVLAASPSSSHLFLAIWHALIPVWSWTLLPSFILAVFIVSGSMMAQGEQTALHGAGISPWRMSRQPLLTGGLLTVISAWTALFAAPVAQQKFKETIQQMVARGIADTLVPGTFIEPTDDIVFFADRKDAANRFHGVYMEYPRNRTVQILVAESARVTLVSPQRQLPQQQLNVTVYNGELFFLGNDLGNDLTVFSFKKMHLSLSLTQAITARSDFLPAFALASSSDLLHKTATGRATRTEKFEFYRRIIHPVTFASIAVLSVILAFFIPWRHRYAAMGAGVALFILSQTLTRGAQTLMLANVLSPATAAALPLLLFLPPAILWPAAIAVKKQLNSLCKNKVSCR